MVLRLNQIASLILYEMYLFFSAHGAPEDMEMEIIKERLQGFTSDVFWDAAIDDLRETELISIVGALPTTFVITTGGIKRVERELDDPTSFVAEHRAKHHANISHKSDVPVPASDRIVTLDDNDPKVKKVRQALDQVAEEIRKNNNYAETEPADWGQRMAESEASKRLFTAPQISVETIRRVALSSLQYLAKKFVDHAIGIAATAAIAAIIAFLG